ncbi:hypothetical protein FRX31_030773, partial [Thalictrum thalictroides]
GGYNSWGGVVKVGAALAEKGSRLDAVISIITSFSDMLKAAAAVTFNGDYLSTKCHVDFG